MALPPAALTVAAKVAALGLGLIAAKFATAGATGSATKLIVCVDRDPLDTQAKSSPAPKALVLTATGEFREVVLLLPSCPEVPNPQAATVPSEQRAKLWKPPAPIATTVLPERTPDVETRTGTVLAVL